MVAIFFPPPQQLNSASTPTSSHQTSFFQPNLPDVQITQYGEARRFNHLDSAKALPDTLAYEGSEMSAEVNRQKKRRKRKRKKCGARKCEAPPDESQASPEDESTIELIVEDVSGYVKDGNVFDENFLEAMCTFSSLSSKSLDKLRRAIHQRLSDDAKAAKEQASPKDDLTSAKEKIGESEADAEGTSPELSNLLLKVT